MISQIQISTDVLFMFLSAFICVCPRQNPHSFLLTPYHLQRRFRHFIISVMNISRGRMRKDADGLLNLGGITPPIPRISSAREHDRSFGLKTIAFIQMA